MSTSSQWQLYELLEWWKKNLGASLVSREVDRYNRLLSLCKDFMQILHAEIHYIKQSSCSQGNKFKIASMLLIQSGLWMTVSFLKLYNWRKHKDTLFTQIFRSLFIFLKVYQAWKKLTCFNGCLFISSCCWLSLRKLIFSIGLHYKMLFKFCSEVRIINYPMEFSVVFLS